jgi:anti-anti-sigma factor
MNRQRRDRIRLLLFTLLPLLLIAFGWSTVVAQSRSLENATIKIYQDAQLEVVRNAARAARIYIQNELELRGPEAVHAIEQDVLRLFVKPVHIGDIGDAWIYTPEYVVYDESEDFPAEYIGKSMAEIFTLQQENGARHYEEMTANVQSGQEGIGWYVWEPDKARESTPLWEFLTRDSGIEVAAWTPVRVFPETEREAVWIIGMSAMLPRLMQATGAYAQIQSSIITMVVVTAVAGLLILLLWQREWALLASEAHYRAVVEDQTELIARFRPNGVLTFVNDAFCRYFGKPREALLGQNFLALMPTADRERHRQHLATLTLAHPTATIVHQVKNGHAAPRWLQLTERVIMDQHQHIVEFQAVGQDITDQKQSEEERTALQEQVIESQRVAIRELSTPLIPLTDDVVIMPLIGTIDSQRAQQVLEVLLTGIAAHQAETVILDITGVQVIDTQVAGTLLRAAQAVKLLGAEVLLTGIQPEIAQTLVQLGVDLRSIKTRSSLQSGIAAVLDQHAPDHGR